MKFLASELLLGLLAFSGAADPAKLPQTAVQLEITRVSKSEGSFHWTLTNRSEVEVYVYDIFLLGPAFRIERFSEKVIFAATPIAMDASCPPNRYLPPLLLLVRSGGRIEGDFSDPEIRTVKANKVSFKIAVGPEPHTVVTKARRFLQSDCRHSPYDAIVLWGTIIESNAAEIPNGQ